MGISFTQQRLFFHKVTFIIKTIPPLVHGTPYADRVKLFAEASELFTNAEFQLVPFRKTESSECKLQGAKKTEVGGSYIGTVQRMRGKSRPHCCNCLPYTQTGRWSGVVMREDLNLCSSSRSCCGPSCSSALEFVSQLDAFVHTYTYTHTQKPVQSTIFGS